MLPDIFSDSLAPTETFQRSGLDSLIQPFILFPEAEPSRRKVPVDIFACLAAEGEFEVIDGTGPVGGQVRDKSALHQFQDDRGAAAFDDSAAEHQKYRGAEPAGLYDGIRKHRQGRMGESFGERRRVDGHIGEAHLRPPCRNRRKHELRAVKHFIRRHRLENGFDDLFRLRKVGNNRPCTGYDEAASLPGIDAAAFRFIGRRADGQAAEIGYEFHLDEAVSE